MATKPLTTEAIALTERKMDMTLDDIIKMSKKTTTTKERRPPRLPNKSQGFLNGIASQRNTKVQRFMDSRSSVRQGVLAQRRSSFRGNQFPVTTSVARKAAVMPIRNMVVSGRRPRVAPATAQRNATDSRYAGKDTTVLPKQRPQTLDALFSNMKESRMKVMSTQQQSFRVNTRQRRRSRQQQQQQEQQLQGVRGSASGRWAK